TAPGRARGGSAALLRATQVATTVPGAPPSTTLAAALQEAKLGDLPPLPDPSRFRAPEAPEPAPDAVARAAALLSGAASPVIMIGRSQRTMDSWRARVALAEKLGARLVSHLKVGATLPPPHP